MQTKVVSSVIIGLTVAALSAVSLGQYPPTKRYTSTTDFQEGQFDNVHDSGDRLEITPPDALRPYTIIA
ncbi:MAG TPA: hypothetical protein PLC79_10585 [Phycisphaerae bacterium]|nr:hypothetical protein [Phycisphaerae bacterium]